MDRRAFLQAGVLAGSSLGLVASRANQKADLMFFDVTDFGAVGDGVNDDTEAIQSAIDAASEPGGVVLLPAGSYCVTQVMLRSHVTLQGAGETSRIEATRDRTPIYGRPEDGLRDCALRDLRIFGYGEKGSQSHSVDLRGPVGARIVNVLLENGSLDNLRLADAEHCQVVGCTSRGWHGSRYSGILIVRGGRNVISACTITDGPWVGLTLEDTEENIAEGNSMHRLGHSGVNVFKAAHRNRVALNNISSLTGGSGIVVDGFNTVATGNLVVANRISAVPTRGIYNNNARRTSIVDNHIRGSKQSAGVYVRSGEDGLIAGNHCADCINHGIQVAADGRHWTVSGNHCERNSRQGIDVDAANCQIVGNQCHANGHHGIFVRSEDSCVLTGNICVDNGHADPDRYAGIVVSSAPHVISGNYCANSEGTGPQRYGIFIESGRGSSVTGNICRRNRTANLLDAGRRTELSNNVVG